MATALGFRLLCRYYEGTATVAQLDTAKTKNWINQAEYDLALTGEPPVGYVPTPERAALDDA
jgi:hypothetical protein